MFWAFLAIIAATAKTVASIVGATQRIDETLADLNSAIDGLNEQIAGVEKDRVREQRQADEVLEDERERILAEQGDVVADMEREIRNRGAENGLAQADIDRQVTELYQNRDAALARAALEQEQAEAQRDLTVSNIAERIAAGDVEAARRVDQIIAKRDQFLATTKDSAILTLNRAGQQLEYTTARAGMTATLTIDQKAAAIAGSSLRRSGSPLLALRQVEMVARAEQREETQSARYNIIGSAQDFRQRVEQARTNAGASVEDVMAANAMEDMQLEQERERMELDFAATYENLEASKVDIEREATQSEAALEAQRNAEDLDYQQDLAAIEDAAADAKRRLDAELTAAITANRQRKEDVQDQADFLTQQYRRSITDATRHRDTLISNRPGIIAGLAITGASDILNAANSFVDALPAPTPIV